MIIADRPIKICHRLVATIGMFDGVHSGHCFLIDRVRQEASRLGLASAVITFSSHPREVLHPDTFVTQLTSYDERIKRLAATGLDYAIVMTFNRNVAELSALDFLSVLHNEYNVDVLLIGYDHRFGHNRCEGFAEYRAYGKELGIEVLEATPFRTTDGIASSSTIRQALSQGNIRTANNMLGYHYTIEGTVVEGHQLGRKLGFPTANLQLNDSHKLLPMLGVYAVKIRLNDNSRHGGMMNIGMRPTVSGDKDITAEVHLFDFSGNLYGQKIEVEFIDFMRPEAKYSSTDELQAHLHKDACEAKRILNL